MSQETRVGNPIYSLLPFEVEGFPSLAELALDLRWSWSSYADELWQQLDPALWEETHNPWVVLQTVSRDTLRRAAADPEFRNRLGALVAAKRRETDSTSWFDEQHSTSSLKCVAYFSMEFMLSEALPIYSGGLGNVAGDQLKSASDLGVPVTGVGLLYQRGYFRQVIDKSGAQQALYPYNDPGQLPIIPLRDQNGEWMRLELKFPGYRIFLRTWQVQVGRVKLYLLDSNDPANLPACRGITTELYGGGPELRLQQELILGIGGWRLLERLGIRPEVCHLNEGHAAFAVLDRARAFMKQTGEPFATALSVTRVGNLFTTHTAVPAGFDRFPAELIAQYLGGYAQEELGISISELLALGRVSGTDLYESFNMAHLAVRGSGAVNAVSRLHGRVSRHLFAPLFPRWPIPEVPVSHVTNGVHVPSWDSVAAAQLWVEYCGHDTWLQPAEILTANIRRVPDDQLWKLRTDARHKLVEFARIRLADQLAAYGAPDEQIEGAKLLFDPNALTLGFARRFATYKRPNLLLRDRDRLLRLLTSVDRPVQLVIAGKAHPADREGQAMIQEWTNFIRTSAARARMVFLSDYDMLVTEQLVNGVDVWINTPRRPWEASGTSGMKVLANGGLNLSELDGWWVEAYKPEVGWALGDGQEHSDIAAWDAEEAEDLYNILEQQVVPQFYTRDAHGIPVAWVARIRESMAQLTPQYSSNRSVREYTEQNYIPAADSYLNRSQHDGAIGRRLVEWRRMVEQKWPGVRFGVVSVHTAGDQHLFELDVYLGELDPSAVKVQLYTDGPDGGVRPDSIDMIRANSIQAEAGGYRYQASAPTTRPASDYTARVIPWHAEVLVPLEESCILWQR